MTKTTKGRRRITFTFEEPGAGQVRLTGDFNQWDIEKHPMRKRPDGVWEKIVMLPPGRFEYKFKVDGQWRCDPATHHRSPNPFDLLRLGQRDANLLAWVDQVGIFNDFPVGFENARVIQND